MSASVRDGTSLPQDLDKQNVSKQAIVGAPKGGNYKGFVAGVFSGIAKLSVGYAVC